MNDVRSAQCVDEALTGSIAARHFGSVNMDFAIIDLKSGQCGQDMFDHLDRRAMSNERGPARTVDAILNDCWNPWITGKVGSDKNHARVRCGRRKRQVDISAAPEPET